MAERVLLVEDERNLSDVLAYNLEREGYAVECAYDGDKAWELFEGRPPDLVLLDVMLPGLGGLELCRLIRARSSLPVILLTARGEEADKIRGLDLGADDYVAKPFSLGELMARVRAQLRRSGTFGQRIEQGRLCIDRLRFSLEKDGHPLPLPRKEFLLLWELASHPNVAIPGETLLRRVWGEDFYGEEQTLAVHVRRLREKIEEDPSHPALIETVRGVGYRWGG
ncbi:MAG: response regulator transcription factor [Coprothermobacterota bacterium]|jgi:DNA-binding response OmpR family regulator|nr:response regulator transcription factor [Coprothermobacterota bacterium]